MYLHRKTFMISYTHNNIVFGGIGMISESWVTTMLELRHHIKSLTCNVSGECWRLAKYELVVARAIRDLAVVMFNGDVAIIWDDSTLSLGEINDLIDSHGEIIATMDKT